jgi:hypothetical protein
MSWNPNPIREGLRSFIDLRGLKILPWAKRAGVSDGALRHFLSGYSDSMNLETLGKLADAEGVSIAELIGQAPEPLRGATQQAPEAATRQVFVSADALDVERMRSIIVGVIRIAIDHPRNISPELVAQAILTVYATAPEAEGDPVTVPPSIGNVIAFPARAARG